jgi:hypothetical protein
MPYPIPSEHERQVLFAWLKQASSLTAWRRIYTFNQVFVDAVTVAYEDEQKTLGAVKTIPASGYADVLRGPAAFRAALERLEQGDRRCFTFLRAPGHFSGGLFEVKWWQNMYSGYHSGRNGWDVADSPHWPQIETAMHASLAALSDVGVVLQVRFSNEVPATITHVSPYLAYEQNSLIRHLNNQSTLAAVPRAVSEVLVPTGQTIPCYGVWEPVRIGHAAHAQATPKGLPHTLVASREVDGRTLDGCMNYLHADFAAPTIAFREDGQGEENRPTTWRLVWRDDRYGDSPVPDEEQNYVFVRPVPGEVLFKYGGRPGR